MKRLSILFVGLLSVVLVFSVVGLSDTEDTAQATLVLDDVIDVTIDDQLSGIYITQNDDLADWNDNDAIGKKTFGHMFTVNVLTMTSYNVKAKYSATIQIGDGTQAPDSLGGNPLYVNSSSKGGSYPDTQLTTSFGDTSLNDDFDGTNNMDSAGESQAYELKIDPSKITNNFDAGNKVDFTVTVQISDSDL